MASACLDCFLGSAAILLATPARAAGLDMFDSELSPVMLAALIIIITLGALMLNAMRRRHAQKERQLAQDLERARAEVDRVKQFLAGEPQIVVVWDRADNEPRVEGEFTLVSDAMNPRRILAFSGWLDADTAARV